MQIGNELAYSVLPDEKDIKGVVADYFDCLVSEEQVLCNRDDIIENCEGSFSSLIHVLETSQSLGIVEQLIFATFIRDIVMVALMRRYGKDY